MLEGMCASPEAGNNARTNWKLQRINYREQLPQTQVSVSGEGNILFSPQGGCDFWPQ